MQNLTESFRDFVEVEGNSIYPTPHHGLQEAKEYQSFVSFPPVLCLQLKRWKYDTALDQMVKVH